jgi:hypothetical protein
VEQRRRAFLTEPGDALVLARTAFSVVERYSEFASESGLDGKFIANSPLVAVPMPIASKGAGPRGWSPDANPALFWLPLFWLPSRVALRYRFDSASGDDDFETEQEWLVRVALELTMSELYSPTDGTWLDVLAFYGLDVESQEVQDRVTAWLSGAPDEVLDGIDLSPLVDLPDDEHWAVESTAELLPALRPASWALIANDLAEMAGELSLDVLDVDEIRIQVAMLVNLALATIADVPSSDSGAVTPSVLWLSIRDAASSLTPAGADDSLAVLSDSFYEIRDDYWPFVELLNQEISDQDADGGRIRSELAAS